MPYLQYEDGDVQELDVLPANPGGKIITKKAYEVAKRAKVLKELGTLLVPGDTVRVVCTSYSRRGLTSHSYRVFAVDVRPSGKPARFYVREITHLVQHACGFRWNRDRDAIMLGGCGYSKPFHIVYALGRAMWPEGTPVVHGTRNGEPDRDGGYALHVDS